MKSNKRTYALPIDTVERFEKTVLPGQRSAVVGELIARWLEDREREELRRLVIEGCREMAETALEVEREWHPLEEEVARGNAL